MLSSIALLALNTALALPQTAEPPPRRGAPSARSSSDLPRVPVETKIEIQQTAGGRWFAKFTFESGADIPNGYAKISVQGPVQVESNETPWRGSSAAGQALTFKVQFSAQHGTEFRVTGSVYSLGPDGSWIFSRRTGVWARFRQGRYSIEPIDQPAGVGGAEPGPLEDPTRTPPEGGAIVKERALRAAAARQDRLSIERHGLPKLVYNRGVNDALYAAGPNATVAAGTARRYYRFYGRAGDRVIVRLWADRFDGSVRLFDPTGVLVAENDDTYGWDPQVPERGLLELSSEGFYTIEVGGQAGPGSDGFRLVVTCFDRRESLHQILAPYVSQAGDAIILSWDPTPKGPVELEVERSCDGEPYAPLLRISRSAGRYVDQLPLGARSCRYRLAASGEEWREETTALEVTSTAPPRRSSSSTVSLQGEFTYHDPHQEPHEKRVRHAKVVIVEQGSLSSEQIAQGYTEADGRFSIDVDLSRVAGKRLRARLTSESGASDRAVGEVLKNDLLCETLSRCQPYQAESEDVTVPTSATAVVFPKLNVSSRNTNAPFFIYDSLVEGFLGAQGHLGFTPPQATLFYPQRNWFGLVSDDSGAGYHFGPLYIGAKYEADRDVVLHEYGHFLADIHLFLDRYAGGPHHLNGLCGPKLDSPCSAHLAWNEGWAHFFAVAVQHAGGLNDTTLESHNPENRFRFNLETGDVETGDGVQLQLRTRGENSEVPVAQVLWDLYDDGQDPLVNDPALRGFRDEVRLPLRDIFDVARGGATGSAGRVPVYRMLRFYGSLFENLDTAWGLRQQINNLFRDQQMHWAMPPDPPSLLRATSGAADVTLRWQGRLETATASFEIQRRRQGVRLFSGIGQTRENTYTDRTPVPNEVNEYRVRAFEPHRATVDPAGEVVRLYSPPSNTVAVRMGTATPPVRPVAVGQVVTGNLSASAGRSTRCSTCYADLYEFTLTTSQTLVISMTSTAFDTYLRVLDASGRVIAEDDDSGEGLNSLVRRTFAPGTYRIEATSYDPGATGPYTLSLQAVVVSVRPISVGQTVQGNLSPAPGRSTRCSTCYADLYEFTLTTSQTLVISMTSTAFDTYLRVLDASGRVIAEDDDSGEGLNSLVRRTFAPGTYRIEATSYDSGATGPYTLSLQAVVVSVRPISVGQTVQGNLSPASGRSTRCSTCYADLYEFTLTTSQTLVISMTSTAFDTYLRVLDASGRVIAEDDDGGEGLNSLVRRTFAPGAYRIEATSYDPGATGPYTLSLQAVVVSVRPISVGQTVQGNLSPASGRSTRCSTCYADLYEFTLTTSQTLVISMTSTAFDTYLQILDANGVTVATDDDSGGGTNSLIRRTFAPGTYRIEATSYGSGEMGPYTLSLQSYVVDLVVISLTAPRSGTIGGYLEGVEVRVQNRGSSGADRFRLGFYFSTDPTITTSDVFSGWYCDVTEGLAAGQTFVCSGRVGVPSSLSSGLYYFGAIADDRNQVSEVDETNNSRAADTGPVTLSR